MVGRIKGALNNPLIKYYNIQDCSKNEIIEGTYPIINKNIS